MRYLIILLLTSVWATTFTMQKSSSTDENCGAENCFISMTDPEFNPRSGAYTIEFYDDQNKVGYISYVKDKKEQDAWKIYLFRVHGTYRKNGLGRLLFQECISDIKRQGATSLQWEAQPLDSSIDLEELITIYQRIVQKSGFHPNALSIMRPDKPSYAKFVNMRLQLT